MKSWLGLSTLGLTLLAAACGAPGDESATTSNADTTPAPSAEFETFATRADAEAFIAAHVNDIFPDIARLAADDPKVVRVQTILDQQWPAVVAKYNPPFPEPIVFVTDDPDVVNAQAMFDWHTDQALNIILVDGGLLNLTDQDIAAVLLHESGHLTTKNGIERYAQALDKYYQANATDSVVGISAADDPAIRTQLGNYLDNLFTVGAADMPELDGIPSGRSSLAFFLKGYDKQHNDTTNPDCATLTTDLASITTLLAAGASPFDDTYTLTDDARATLAQTVTAVQSLAISCLKPPADVDLEAAVDPMFQAPAGSFAQQLGPQEAALWANKDAMTGLFAVTRDLQTQERTVTSAANYKQLREYTAEEQADDFAMTVMASEGTDLGQMKTLFVDLTADPSYRAQCASILTAGGVPPYKISDEHHGNCYRAFHVGQFQSYLASGGKGVVIPYIAPPPPKATAARAVSPYAGRQPWKNSTF